MLSLRYVKFEGPKDSYMEMLSQKAWAGDTDFGIVDLFMVTEGRTWTKSPREKV